MSHVYVDFDGTLVRTNSLHYLVALRAHQLKTQRSAHALFFWALAWLLLPLVLILHKISEPARDRLTYFLYRGLTPEALQSGARAFWKRKGPQVFRAQVVALLHVLAAQGHRIVVVSGSLKEIIQPALQARGLDGLVDAYLTAELHYDADQRCRGLKGQPHIQEEKVKRIQAYESASGSLPTSRKAITDSLSDRPLLEFCDTRYVVAPSSTLQKLAQTRNWWILQDPEFPAMQHGGIA